MSARHRRDKLLLRLGITYAGKTAWTVARHERLRRQRFELLGVQAAFEAAHDEVVADQNRRTRRDDVINVLAARSEFTGVVHGVGSYHGLVPTEISLGPPCSQGAPNCPGFGGSPALP